LDSGRHLKNGGKLVKGMIHNIYLWLVMVSLVSFRCGMIHN
jgi:hypothetical protein